MKNKFTFSIFLAFMLSKATNLADKLNANGGPHSSEMFYSVLQPAQKFFKFFGFNHISAIQIFEEAGGFKGSAHTLNFLITYTPLFFVLILLLTVFKKQVLGLLGYIAGFFLGFTKMVYNKFVLAKKLGLYRKPKKKGRAVRNREYWLLKLVIGKDMYTRLAP